MISVIISISLIGGVSIQKGLKFQNVILIGWDGVQREHLYNMLEEGLLPNLEKIVSEGNIVDVDITSGSTHTKPGWAEILTGYSAHALEIYSNSNYKPIPVGYTIFERLEEYFGRENIVTVFIGGKINNIGARGPHKICANCLTRYKDTREKTGWWREDTQAPTKIPGQERIFLEREGEPYFHTKNSLDLYVTALGEAQNVGEKALSVLEKYNNNRYFMFFHFEEPDELGHVYGENSEEYSRSIITNDHWLGEIVAKLKELGTYEDTIVYIVADHGFDEGGKGHSNAPYVFLASNNPRLKKAGDRKDVTPTVLAEFNIDTKKINPPLEGRSLLEIGIVDKLLRVFVK